MREHEEKPLGEILKIFKETNKQLKKGLDEIDVADAWVRSLGKSVNQYTQKLKFRDGVVYAYLNSSTMRQELSFRKEKIIELLNKELREDLVKEVILR